MKYETYKRIRVSHPFLVLLQYGGLAVILAFVLPFMISTGKDHLKLNAAHAVRFVHTIPDQESQGMRAPAHRADRLRQCRRTARDHGMAGCQLLDWLEIVESDSDNLFVTTVINERFESRPKVPACVASSSDSDGDGEIDPSIEVPQLWGWDAELDDNHTTMTVAPEDTLVRIEHRLANDDVRIDDAVGFILTAGECRALEGGESLMKVLDSVRLLQDDGHGVMLRRVLRGGRDVVRVAELLDAAGVSIEQVRTTGTHLDVKMVYTNLAGRFESSPLNNRSMLSNLLIDTFTLPSDLVYAYCVDAVLPHEARFFFSSRVDSNPRLASKDVVDRQSTNTNKVTTDGEECKETSEKRSRKHKKKSKKELRMIKTHIGVRAKFRAVGHIGSFSLSSFLSFLAGSLALIAVPWNLAEFLLSYWTLFETPVWWTAFVEEF